MSEPTKQVAFRLPESLVERLDAYAEELSRAQPGIAFTRADAVRVLLTRALEGVEKGRSWSPSASRSPSSSVRTADGRSSDLWIAVRTSVATASSTFSRIRNASALAAAFRVRASIRRSATSRRTRR